MKKKITTDTIFTFSGMILFQLLNFIIGVIISRFASVGDLGAYQFFIVTTTFFGFFSKMGVDEKITYLIPYSGGVRKEKSKELIYNLFSKTLLFSFVSALATILFYFILSKYSENTIDIKDAFFSLIYLPAFSIVLIIASVFRSENYIKIRSLLLYLIPSFLSILIIGIIIKFFEPNKFFILLMRSLVYLITAFLGGKLLLRIFSIDLIKGVRSVKKFVSFDKSLFNWLIITIITFLIETGTVGLWMVRFSSDDFNIGVVSIILRLASLTYIMPTAIGIVFGPQIAKLNSNKLPYKAVVLKMIMFTVISVSFVTTFIFLFSNEVLTLFSKNIGSYSKELSYILVGTSFIAITQPIQSVALAIYNVKKITTVSLLGGGVSFLFFYFSLTGNSITDFAKSISYSMIIYSLFRFSYLILYTNKNIRNENII